MKTITIAISFNERELELLRMGKCDKPDPQRVKLQMLSEAAKNLRWLCETVMDEARGRPQAERRDAREVHNAKLRANTGVARRYLEKKGVLRKRSPAVPRKAKPSLTTLDALGQLPPGTTGRIMVQS